MNFNTLLFEATEYSDEYELAKAILRGQIPGVSAKKFFGEDRIVAVENAIKNKKASMATSALKSILRYKNNFRKQDQNAAIALMLRKTGHWSKITGSFNIDPYITYFDNRNKKEVKENNEIKALFKKFEETSAEDEFNKEFEQKINAKFAQKAKMKSDDEVEVVYPEDDKGWYVVSPKTFAAAKKLACMGDRKAHWCTSANEYQFNRYSAEENKLFIIRNDKLNKMFQMDFGVNGKFPNFMDEDDYSMSLEDFAKTNFPEELLKSIKNKKGEDLYNFIKEANTKEEEIKKANKETIEANKKKIDETLKKNSFNIGDWQVHKMFSKKIAEEKFGIKLSDIHLYGFEDWEESELDKYVKEKEYNKNEYVYQALRDNSSSKVKEFNEKDLKENKYFYIFVNKDNKFYYIDKTTHSKIVKGPQKFSLYQVNEKGPVRHIDLKEFLELNLSQEIKKVIKPGLDEKMENKFKDSFEKIKKEPDYKLIINNGNIKVYKINNLSAINHFTPKIAKKTFLNPKIITREKKGEEPKLRNLSFKMLNNFNNLYYFNDYYTDGKKIIYYYKGKINIENIKDYLQFSLAKRYNDYDAQSIFFKLFPELKKEIISDTMVNTKDYEIIQYPYDSKISFLLIYNSNGQTIDKLKKMFTIPYDILGTLDTGVESRNKYNVINGLFIVIKNKLYNVNEEKLPKYLTTTNKEKDVTIYIRKNGNAQEIKLKYGPWLKKIQEKLQVIETGKYSNAKGISRNYYINTIGRNITPDLKNRQIKQIIDKVKGNIQ